MRSYKIFVFKLFTFAFILLSLSLAHSGELKKFTKQEWEQLSEDVDSWVDYLDVPIDAKIKELVISLNAVGIVTTASCEGHLKRALPYPWIEIDIQN